MAQCKQTAQEFIQDSFSPHVAVLCSHDAELVCKKNNLSFVELIQPFCRLNTEAHIRDPNNVPHVIRNLRIVVKDMNAHIPQPTLAKKILNEIVGNLLPSSQDTMSNIMSVGNYDLQLSATTPWYEAYREKFMQLLFPADHEFSAHFLACMFVVSSSHANAMDQFQWLTQQQHQQQHQQPHKPPKWFCPNILRYYVLVHDVSDTPQSKAESVYQTMKTTYGSHACHLLQINSNKAVANGSLENNLDTVLPPNPWSLFLQKKTHQDVDEGRYGDIIPDDDTQQLPSTVTEDSPHPPHELTSAEPSAASIESALEVTEALISNDEGGRTVNLRSSEVVEHPLVQTDDIDNPLRDSQNNVASSGQSLGSRGVSSTSTGQRGGDGGAYHGGCLSLSDHDRLRIFINEFAVRGLIPWSEKTLRSLNEQVITRLKGIQRSLFGVTKKWFSSNKPANQIQHTERTNVVYTGEAPEMQLRRLGDLAFLFQVYDLAYTTFHAAKRDFNTDQAWLHYAAALEMASLAVFMQPASSQRQYPHHYMETAVNTYLTSCRSPQYATRATLLNTEALKSRGMYPEAAAQFIKMTCEQDSDLRSALLLEQAAHCFIQRQPPLVRKYSFHMILAGHRFSKGGQRRHALRSYNQALQVYKGKDWTLAEDHIHFTLGRQSFNLKQLENSSQAFKHLLTGGSQQHALQQAAFLREFLFVFKQQNSEWNGELPQLPLPVIQPNMIKVCCGEEPQPTTGEEQEAWSKLEELSLLQILGTIPLTHQPFLSCYTPFTLNSANPRTVLTEAVNVEVTLNNPFKIPLILNEVYLLWQFVGVDFSQAENGGKPPMVVTNETPEPLDSMRDSVVKTDVLSEILLQPQAVSTVVLQICPLQTGELHITGMAYRLGCGSNEASVESALPSNITVCGKLTLDVQGPRLNTSKEEKACKMYAPDRRLDLIVVPPMPCLLVELEGLEETALCGQVQHLTLCLTNNGSLPLRQLQLASTHPHLISLTRADQSESSVDDTPLHMQLGEGAGFVEQISLPGSVLAPGHTVRLSVWVQAPNEVGDHSIHWLFTYRSTNTNPKMTHRVTRHSLSITTTPSILVKASTHRSHTSRPITRASLSPHSAAQPSLAAQTGSAVQPSSAAQPGTSNSLTGLLIMVEVHNNNLMGKLGAVCVTQVSCVSPQWTLHSLSNKTPADEAVRRGHCRHLCLKASKCDSTTPAGEDGGVVFSSVLLTENQTRPEVPYSDFYRRWCHRCDLRDVEAQSSMSSSTMLDPEPTTFPLRPYTTAVDANLTLVILWTGEVERTDGERRPVMGQLFLDIPHINTPVSSEPQRPVESGTVQIIPDRASTELASLDFSVASRLVTYSLRHPTYIKHPFSKQRICSVDVSLELCNHSGLAVQVSIQASRSAAVQQEDSSSMTCPTSLFSWGSHVTSQLTMASGSSKCLPLQACFAHPGSYNLSMLNILVSPLVQPAGVCPVLPTAQQPAPPTLIQIQSS